MRIVAISRNKVLPILLIMAVATVGGFAHFVNGVDASSPPLTSSPTPATALPPSFSPTQLPLPPDPNKPVFFPEIALEYFEYGPDLYPQYAEAFPNTPCATWENGGLIWFVFANEMLATTLNRGWEVLVRLPTFRFCGFPWPYPLKPIPYPENRTPYPPKSTPNRTGIWERTPTPEPTSSPPEFMMPTVLPPPNPEILEFFPEYVMERYAYDPASYPQYAEVLPDAPCATWVNGGLTWSFFEDTATMKLGWGASVWIPIYRFCGFPLPYPQKPAQTKIENAPREWVIWKSTQMAGTPTPTSSP